MPDAADVDVDEVGLGVVTDASTLHGESGIADFRCRYAGNADVDGFGFHVLAVEGDSVAVLAQVVVAPGRAVAADDIDDAVGVSEASHEVVEEIEFADVVVLDVSSAVVAEEVVELGNGSGEVVVADAVDDVDALAGVQVVEVQAVGLRGRRGVGRCGAHSGDGEEQNRGGEDGFLKRHGAVNLEANSAKNGSYKYSGWWSLIGHDVHLKSIKAESIKAS